MERDRGRAEGDRVGWKGIGVDWKRVESGKSVDLGGRRLIKIYMN